MIEEKPGLTHTISSGAVSMSPELFEKVWTNREQSSKQIYLADTDELSQLYLTPKTPHAGDNIRRFANPTPLGFVG